MSETKPSSPGTPQAHCVGRFNFKLPEALRPSGREQSLYRLKVWSEPATTPVELAQLWVRTKASMVGAKNAEPAKVVNEYDIDGVGPALWVVPSAMYPDDREVLAMKPGKAHALFLRTNATVGREQVTESVVRDVAAGYVAQAPFGLCVEHGAFDLKPSKNERAGASFVTADGIELSFLTETVAEPDDGQSSSASAVNAPELQVLSKGDRQAAGLKGIEEKVRVAEKGKPPQLAMTWIFPGEAANGLRPRIRLMISAPEARAAAATAAWDMLLGSLQPRPLGQKK